MEISELDLTGFIRRFAAWMNGTKCILLFFAPVSRINRTDDRTKANKDELKRIEVAHASFAFAENTPYFAHLLHIAYPDAPFSRHHCAYDGASFHARYNAYDCVILTRRYCAYNCMAFLARHTRFNAGDFVVSLLWLLLRGFHGAL